MIKYKEKLSKGERSLLIAVSLFSALVLGIVYWQYTLEVNPLISLPAKTPELPHPYAQAYYDRACDQLNELQITAGGKQYSYGYYELEPFCGGDTNEQENARKRWPRDSLCRHGPWPKRL